MCNLGPAAVYEYLSADEPTGYYGPVGHEIDMVTLCVVS